MIPYTALQNAFPVTHYDPQHQFYSMHNTILLVDIITFEIKKRTTKSQGRLPHKVLTYIQRL